MVRPNKASGRWRRAGIRLLALIVIAAVSAAGWTAFHRTRPVQLALGGRPIDAPEQVLHIAEQRTAEVVTARHGVRSDRSRCYFMTGARSLTGRVSVIRELACGPLLFVDGDTVRPYLTFDLNVSTTANGRATLSVDGAPTSTQISGEQDGRNLVRPDGLQPPVGTGGLQAPAPPAAVNDVLTKATSLGSGLQDAPASAVMIGRSSGAQLTQYGFVDRYGSGDRARSAPPGRRLLAFAVTPVAGETGDSEPRLSIRIGDNERGPLVNTSDFVVTAVPTGATKVDLVLTDSGVKQSISLLTGVPGGDNPAVDARVNRAVPLTVSQSVTVSVKGPTGNAGITSGKITLTGLSLSYWAADGSHARRPDRALLHVMATVRLTGDPYGYGAETGLITLTVGSGTRLTARNAAANQTNQIDNVIDVPAAITSGTISYSGTVATSKGTITVVTPVNLPFTIPSG
jgi:hypothetical protein